MRDATAGSDLLRAFAVSRPLGLLVMYSLASYGFATLMDELFAARLGLSPTSIAARLVAAIAVACFASVMKSPTPARRT